MRSELNLIGLQMELFEQFSGVAMSEDRVRGEIVGCVHEVGFCRWGFSSAAYSGLRITDNAMIDVDQAGAKQRRKGEDDGSGIASGVGNQAGVPDFFAMQLRTTVDCFRLEFCGVVGVYICKTVHSAVDMVF